MPRRTIELSKSEQSQLQESSNRYARALSASRALTLPAVVSSLLLCLSSVALMTSMVFEPMGWWSDGALISSPGWILQAITLLSSGALWFLVLRKSTEAKAEIGKFVELARSVAAQSLELDVTGELHLAREGREWFVALSEVYGKEKWLFRWLSDSPEYELEELPIGAN